MEQVATGLKHILQTGSKENQKRRVLFSLGKNKK
jgi:hypothetical protein